MLNKQIDISVIMATYNRSEFLSRAIESVLKQDFENFELILVNDGSKDNTSQICFDYEKKDKRIRFINNIENGGAGKARNQGIKIAKGSYITFVDDDDYVEKGMLSFLWTLKNSYKADISICGCWYGYGNELLPKYVFDELLVLNKIEGLDELLKREKYNSANPNKLFRKDLFEGIGYLEQMKVDDIHFIYKLFERADRVVAKGVPLYTYTRHKNNNSACLEKNDWTSELLREYIFMQKERVKYLSERVPDIIERVKYSEWSFYLSMCNKIKIYNNLKCINEYDEMLQILRINKEEFCKSKFITSEEKKTLSFLRI